MEEYVKYFTPWKLYLVAALMFAIAPWITNIALFQTVCILGTAFGVAGLFKLLYSLLD